MPEKRSEITAGLRATLERILAAPTPADLWQLQGDLLVLGGETAQRVRKVAEVFCGYLRDLESKQTSRRASRWAATLETAAVSSISLQEFLEEQDNPLRRLLGTGLTAALEIGAAAQHVRAWEVETSLVHCDVAWVLYEELWEISLAMQPDLDPQERRSSLEQLIGPVMDEKTPGTAKAALLVTLLQAVLAARAWPLLAGEK